MIPAYEDGPVQVWHGDCLDVMALLPADSVHAVVTDPPYGLEFLGRAWDRFAPRDFEAWCEQWAREAFRVLRPGGHLLAFGGTRTFHRLAAGIEDAGFQIRDSIAWLYAQGFPKSLNVGKAIDAQLGTERPETGRVLSTTGRRVAPSSFGQAGDAERENRETLPGSEEPAAWEGWGTALKPAFEPIVVARKPLAEPNVAANVLAHGTGALNISAARIGASGGTRGTNYAKTGLLRIGGRADIEAIDAGRWPPNVALDPASAAELDRQSGITTSPSDPVRQGGNRGYGDTGGISRVFQVAEPDPGAGRFRYAPKAPAAERPTIAKEGAPTAYGYRGGIRVRTCDTCGARFPSPPAVQSCGHDGWSWPEPLGAAAAPDTVSHPTVKPLSLMRWMVRLVTPPGGTVLEPFAGSGSTVEAAVLEGFRCVAIEREAEYLPLILQRIRKPLEVGLDLDWDPEAEAGTDPTAAAAAARSRGGGSMRTSVAAATLDTTALDFGDWEAEA